MACCGRSMQVSQAAASASKARGPALFEAHDVAPLTVFGRVTGRRYHFPGPGARVFVDARDSEALEVTRGVTRVDDVT